MELRIKELCKAKGFKMSDLAEKMGVNQANLAASLKGNPTLNRLKDIAKILNVSVCELFSESEDHQNMCGFVEIDGDLEKVATAADWISLSKKIKSMPVIPYYTKISDARQMVKQFVHRAYTDRRLVDSIYGWVGEKELFCLSCHPETVRNDDEEYENMIFILTLMSKGRTITAELLEYEGPDGCDLDSDGGLVKELCNNIESMYESTESATE